MPTDEFDMFDPSEDFEAFVGGYIFAYIDLETYVMQSKAELGLDPESKIRVHIPPEIWARYIYYEETAKDLPAEMDDYINRRLTEAKTLVLRNFPDTC